MLTCLTHKAQQRLNSCMSRPMAHMHEGKHATQIGSLWWA